MRVSGRVRIGPYAGGSKSGRGHQAFLESEEGETYLLRLAGGSPMRDARLEALEGTLVEAEGDLREGKASSLKLLIATRLEPKGKGAS